MNGLYTEEEMPQNFSAHAATEKAASAPLGNSGLIVEKGDVIDPETGETLSLKPANEIKSKNPKIHSIEATLLKLHEEGKAYVYDAEMMAHVEDEKKLKAKAALKGRKYIFIDNNSLLISPTDIPELDIYKLSSPDEDEFDKDALSWEGKGSNI
jgi:hypothetical protein